MATDGPMADSEEDAETSDDEPTLPLARRLRLRRRRDDNDDDDMDSHSDHDDDSDTEGDREGGRGGGGFSVSCRQQWRMNLIFTIVEIKCSFSVHVLRMQSSYAMVAYYTVCVCSLKSKILSFFITYTSYIISMLSTMYYIWGDEKI